MVEALAEKKVVGATASESHTAVWTDAGELFTFGHGSYGQLGHGERQYELLPRLVEALAGKNVAGAGVGSVHTAVWTEAGELFTFGDGMYGRLGHGETGDKGESCELVPRLVEALT